MYRNVQVRALGCHHDPPPFPRHVPLSLSLLLIPRRVIGICADPYDATFCRVDVVLECGSTSAQWSTPSVPAQQRAAGPVVRTVVPAYFDEGAFHSRFRATRQLAERAPFCIASLHLNERPLSASARELSVEWSGGESTWPRLRLVAPADGARGMIAPHKYGQYFEDRADGSLFFPVGPDLSWSGGANTTEAFYGPALDALAAAKANYVRLWAGPSVTPPFSDTQLQRSFGKVDSAAAARMDWVLQKCDENNIRALLALESYK